PGHSLVRQRQVLHRLMYPGQPGAGHGQASGHPGPAGEYDRAELDEQDIRADVDADPDAARERRALAAQLLKPPVEQSLLELELGYSVPQQATRQIGLLEHGHRMTSPGELLGSGKSSRSRPDHGDGLASGDRDPAGWLGDHPAFGERPVDDLHLDLLDRDRAGVDAEHAG